MTIAEQNPENRVQVESALGRPARWSTALPAVLVGCVSLLLAAYGQWLLPAKLPEQYASALQSATTDYATLTGNGSSPINASWTDSAGELDVIYSRLVSLEHGQPQRYWQWAEFLAAHAVALRQRLADPATSLRDEIRASVQDQAEQFEGKSRKIFEQLSVGRSELRDAAFLHIAEEDYRLGIAQFGIPNAASMSKRLQELLKRDTTLPSGDPPSGASQATAASTGESELTGGLSATQLAAANLLWLNVQIEAAWRNSPSSSLQLDQSLLPTLSELQVRWLPDPPETPVQWFVLEKLLAAYRDGSVPDNSVAEQSFAQATSSADWQQQLAALELAALEANWQEVAFQLSSQKGRADQAVLAGLARTICRLACSPHARNNPDWCRQFDLGLVMAAQLAPHLPEFTELIWLCAQNQIAASMSTTLPTQIPEAIATGQSVWLKHSVFALAAAAEGKLDVAGTHLQLIRRAGGNMSIVARTALWRTQSLALPTEDEALQAGGSEELLRLEALLTAAAQQEPESGLNWFVLGTLQHRNQKKSEAISSLQKAQKLLGEVAAIKEMLEELGSGE